MTRYALAILCLPIFQPAFAQEKFQSAFYVTPLGDTVRGLIRVRENYTDEIIYRPSSKALRQKISLKDVGYFGFTNGHQYQKLNLAKKEQTPEDVFAKTILRGSVDLLHYRNQFILFSEMKGIFPLAKSGVTKEAEALKNYQQNIGAFNILFMDCPSVKEEAAKITIKEERLVAILQHYHDCKSLPYKVRDRKSKKILRFGLFAGITSTAISFGGDKPYLKETNFEPSVNPSFGIMILSQPQNPSAIIAFQTELVYSSAAYKTTHYYENDLANYLITQKSEIDINFSRLTLKYGLRFSGRSNFINPYIALGLQASSVISNDSKAKLLIGINSSFENKEEEIPDAAGPGGWISFGGKRQINNKIALTI